MPDNSPTYTHGYHSSVLRSHNNRVIANSAQYLEDYLTPDLHLLDVGSGVGTLTADFAKRLVSGRVTALETSELSLKLTQDTAIAAEVNNVTGAVGDVHELPFLDNTFDIVHAHQVLQHVQNPVQALKEMRRVCKPDGLVAARDSDYDGFIWYPLLPELEEWQRWYQQANRANGGEPNAGRYLLSWAQQAGFTEIKASSSTWCLATPESRAWWGEMWAERILHSQITKQLLASGIADKADLERISRAWRAWSKAKDGWMSIVHGEIIAFK